MAAIAHTIYARIKRGLHMFMLQPTRQRNYIRLSLLWLYQWDIDKLMRFYNRTMARGLPDCR